ncbi:hypothetical protein NDU88_002004 [Pleurodeles waltl]|uniref:Uncharacterized protein n=1 Tax=Pleurodeles waltl TaxID=8319 RepID=A0AAV7LER4_PLEWA|nr:hypothetical protein NDU88_002004 [Pleurodeles waltl]
MRTLRSLRNGVNKSEDLESCLCQFLRAYWQTPHSITKCGPSDFMIRHSTQDLIPSCPKWEPAVIDVQAAQQRRSRNNERETRDRGAVEPTLQAGNEVVIKDCYPGLKYRTYFERETWEVVKVRGTMVTARQNAMVISRNVSQFKRVSSEEDDLNDETLQVAQI